ncbi:FkbM family methyltransferase, partial [Acidithiobacillus sp.]|uniref:FkbM family methyltransferase n=1 Tax=Acidithiobacillus sp. TaxID=1872118 RepID=UPI003CFE0968
QRNHIVLLVSNFGFASAIFWRYILHCCYGTAREFVRTIYWAARQLIGGLGGIAAGWLGLLAGLSAAVNAGPRAASPREKKKKESRKLLNETRRILREEKRLYATRAGLLLRAYDHILWRINRRWPMPLRGSVCQVRLRGLKRPLLARVGTSDFFTLAEIFWDGEYNPLLGAATNPVRNIVDLGANVGYSLRFWMENFPGCRVLAAEPDGGNLALCRRNVELSGVGLQVDVTQACVMGGRGEVQLDVGGGGESGFAVSRDPSKAKKAVTVRAVTVPDLAEALGPGQPIDILKCDIEGSEKEVFKSSATWINRVRLAAVETHSPYSVEELLADIAAAGGDFEVLKRLDKSVGFASLVFLKNKNVPASVH